MPWHMRARLALVLVVAVVAWVGCGEREVVVVVATPTVGPLAFGQAEGVVKPPELTRTAEELRRVREQHAGLIEQGPGTATPEPTADVYDREESAVARVMAAYDDLGYEVDRRIDWFDPERGLYFYRAGGGDWSTARVRKQNPYAPLFYYGSYPEEVPNFQAGTLQRQLARELAFEASRLMPVLGDPTPAMVGLMYSKLGWSIRNEKDPVINVWSTFTVTGREVGVQHFAVGGVVELGVSRGGEGEDWYEYLRVADWWGPVVVERLR